MSNDNFLLTVLGAVGIGALVMGLNQNDDSDKVPIQEDYQSGMTSFGFQRVFEKVAVGKDGCMRAVNFAQQSESEQKINQDVARIAKSGAPQADQNAELERVSKAGTRMLKSRLTQSSTRVARAMAGGVPPKSAETVEKYENGMYPQESMGLGANTVTEPYYVTRPSFEQYTPLRSPSLNLGRDIRYNPPSTDRMGITEAYQNLPQNLNMGTQIQAVAPSSSVEHFDMITENYAAEPEKAKYFANAAGYEALGPDFKADKNSFIKAVATGNRDYADNSQTVVAPLTCQEGCDETASGLIPIGPGGGGGENEPIWWDRPMTVPLKAGWRQTPNGGVDRIRGDLPVCVDPCQAGWFQSSLKPQFLTIGALNNGTVGGNDVGQYVQSKGGQFVSGASSGMTAQEMRIKASPDVGAVVVAGGFQ